MRQFLILSMVLAGVILEAASIRVGNVGIRGIVLPDNAPDSVQLAAKELQKFTEKVTGVKLPVTNRAEGKGFIILGAEKELLKNVGREGFRIKAQNGNLFIAGHDSPSGAVVGIRNPWRRHEVYNEKLKLGAFGETGTLSGVYWFLETFAGIRFYWPGEVGTVIPAGRNIEVPADTDVSKAPIFNCRYVWICDFDQAPEDALWYRRAGFGGIAPVQIIDYNWFFTNKYKNSHPEIFAKVDGKPDFGAMCAVRGGGHLCYSHPNTVPLIAKAICEYFDAHPEHLYFPMLPGDGLVRVCECKQCQSEVDYSGDRSHKFSNHIWGFINRVAKEVAKKHPDKYIGCSAYDSYAAPPSKIDRLEPNVALQFGKNRGAMAAPAYEKFVRDRVAKWRKKTGNMICGWDFYLQCWIPWRGLPCLYSRTIKRDLKAMRAEGFGTEGIEAESWQKNQPHKMTYPATQHLNLYLTAKLYWEPELDLEKFFDEYCRLFYGKAAPVMREFWALCEKRWEDGHKNASGFSIFEIVKPEQVFDAATVDKLDKMLDKALKMVPPGSLYAARLQQLKKEFSIGRAAIIVMVRNKLPEMTALAEKETIKVDGILSEKSWRRGGGAFFVGYCGESTRCNTQMYSRNDGKNLYFGFIMAEPETAKLKTVGDRRDHGKMYLDNGVEIFLMPHPALPNSGYQFIVNSKGQLWDAQLNENRTLNSKWNSRAVAAVTVAKNRWCMEISIPLADIGAVPGQQIKANFYRNRILTDKKDVSSCWSPIMTEGHRTPSRFGTLTIGK